MVLQPHARAQSGTSVTYTSGTYDQDFDGLPTVTPSPDISGNNTFAFGDPTIDASNMPGWYGQAIDNASFFAGNGSSSTAGFYSFSTSPSSGNEALGLIGNSVTGSEVIGLRLVNDTASTTFTSVTISFTGELWNYGNSPGATSSMVFGYSESTNPGASLPLGNDNTNSSLAFTGTNTGSAGAVNGTAPANQTPLSATISLATPWTPGDSLWLTWSFRNPSDNSPGLAIDNLAFAASGAAAPDAVWTGSTSAVWDTTSLNWSTGTYSDGSYVTFGNLAGSGSNITIMAGGVNPAQVAVTNNSGTYVFSGGSIGGSGSISMSGSGMLILGSSNAYSGGTIITGGTLAADGGDDRLGAAGSQVIFDGGQLQTNGTGLVSSRDFVLNSGGGSFNSNGFDSLTSGSLTGSGTFTKIGPGDLTISGGVGVADSQNPVFSVEGGSLTLDQGDSQYFTVPTTSDAFIGDLVIGANTFAEIAGSASFSSPALINGGGAILFSGTNAGIDDTGNNSVSAGYLLIDNNILLNSGSAAQPFAASVGTTTGTFADQLTLDGTISGSSSVNFTGPNGNRAVILLNAPSTYTGNTIIDNDAYGVVRLGVTNALPVTTQLTFGSGSSSTGALDLNGFDQTLAGLSSPDTLTATGITNTAATASTLTINQSIDTSYNSTIGAPGFSGLYGPGTNLVPRGTDLNNINLVKEGSGALELTQYLTYSGSTQVNGGTLIVDGGIAGSSGVSVNTSGTLAGLTGVIVPNGGKVIIYSGGTMAPGDNYAGGGNSDPTGSFSVLDLGNSPSPTGTFDLRAGGNLSITLGFQESANSQGDVSSQLFVQGTISLAGNLTGTILNGFTANPGDLFFIIINQGTSPIIGTFAGNPSIISLSGPNGLVNFAVGYNGNSANNTFTGGNDVVLQVVAIPEPGVISCCLSGVGLFFAFSRRRRFPR